MDTLYRNYEILSEFYQRHYVDLRVLDATCEPSAYPAPVIAHGIVRRYERVANVLLPGKQYRQVGIQSWQIRISPPSPPGGVRLQQRLRPQRPDQRLHVLPRVRVDRS